MPRHASRYALPSGGGSGAATAMEMFNQQQRNSAVNAAIGQRTQAAQIEDQYKQLQILKAQADLLQSQRQLALHMETQRQRSAYYAGAHELEQALAARGVTKGTKDYADAFSEFSSHFPEARSTVDVRQDMKLQGLVHDDQAALTDRITQGVRATQDAMKQTGQNLVPNRVSLVKGGQVDVGLGQPQTSDTEGSDPEAELFKSRGLTKAQFLNPLNAKQGVVNDKGDFTTNFAPNQQANAIQFQAGSSKTDEAKSVTHVMPLSEFNAYRQGLGQQPVSTFQYSGPTPAPTVAPTVQPVATPDQTPIYTPSPSPEATVPPLADIFADQPQTP